MSTTNGDWVEMKRLVLSRLEENTKKLDGLHADLADVKTKLAVLNDREDREMAAAKGIAVRWGSALGALVSAIVSGIIGIQR